jgi:lipopolysaccharide biosynthesis protein
MLIGRALTAIKVKIFKALYCRHTIFGNLRRLRNQVRRSWPGADPLSESRSEAVYVHFDRHGVIHDYVHEQLRALVGAGFRITFVSNATKFPEEAVTEISRFCRQILWRRNVGYDFGAYKDGIKAIGNLDRVERLVLMNDSVYGPFYPLKPLLEAVDPSKTDFWGITDSWELAFHIQSYFLMFFPGALQSKQFREFWHRFPYVNKKKWIIERGEIGLSQLLVQHKFRAGVLAPYWQAAERILEKINKVDSAALAPAHREFLERITNHIVRGTPMNQSHLFWESIVVDFDCPFLKREVIKQNPAGIPFTWRWPEMIGERSSYDLSLISRHLQAD